MRAEVFVCVLSTSPRSFVHVPDGGELLVGRGRGCGVRDDDPRLAPRHARLFRRGVELFVADLGSRTGTRVAGLRIEGEHPARPGDLVVAGSVVLGVALARRADAAGPIEVDGPAEVARSPELRAAAARVL